MCQKHFRNVYTLRTNCSNMFKHSPKLLRFLWSFWRCLGYAIKTKCHGARFCWGAGAIVVCFLGCRVAALVVFRCTTQGPPWSPSRGSVARRRAPFFCFTQLGPCGPFERVVRPSAVVCSLPYHIVASEVSFLRKCGAALWPRVAVLVFVLRAALRCCGLRGVFSKKHGSTG